MGIEIEYPLGYASSGDSLFRDIGNPSYATDCNTEVMSEADALKALWSHSAGSGLTFPL